MGKRKRTAARARTPTGKQNIHVQDSGYSEGAASHSRSIMKGWNPLQSSANADIGANLFTMRNRSADQAINTPLGAAAISTSSTHTIGAGLRAFPRIKYKMLGLTAQQAREWNKRAAEEFDLWAASKSCDITRRNSFYDMQDIAYTGYLRDGDSFAVFRHGMPDVTMPYSLKLQLVEGNRVSNPMGREYYGIMGPYAVEMKAPNGINRIINGVEIDQNGAVAAYWVSNRVPYDSTSIDQAASWVRVDAFGATTGQPNIVQICHDTRAEQYRGVPYLAPVLETLKQVSRYTTAELTSAIIKSFFALFFTSANGGDLNSMLPSSYDGDPLEPVVDVSEYRLGPGSMNALPKGVDVKSVDASNSQSTFEPFTATLIKQIAAAIGQPYEVLMKNFNSSYSASRAAMLQAWEEYKLRRTWFARDFCQPVYEQWLTEAIALGRIEAPGFFTDPLIRKAWCNVEWYGPTMSILDPVKDVTGSSLRTTYALSTRERESAEMTGTDFEENVEQLALEQQIIRDAGIATGNPEVLAGKLLGTNTTEGGEKHENVLEDKK